MPARRIDSGCRSAQGGIRPKAQSPQLKRAAVMTMREATAISERRDCQPEGLSRTVLHYELAGERRWFGYRRLHALVRQEGVQANRKRVYRRYSDAGLFVCRRKRRYGVAVERQALERPHYTERGLVDGFHQCCLGQWPLDQDTDDCRRFQQGGHRPRGRLPDFGTLRDAHS